MSDRKIVKLDGNDNEDSSEFQAYRDPSIVVEYNDDDINYDEADHCLGELLACLHGDGGHYHGKHGMRKATEDAISAHYERIKALDELQTERDRYRAALERISSQWAQPARDIARLAITEADKDKPHD